MIEIYKNLLPRELQIDLPKETKVNCESCNMVKRGIYREALKCCTFYPFLANYLVGEILSSQNSMILRAFIKERRFNLPIGLCAPPAYQLKHRYTSSADFGRKEDLLCPFMKNGGCQIWQSRSSVCFSFYCESSYGEHGKVFWTELESLFYRIELNLSQMAMIELGFNNKELDKNIAHIKVDIFEPEDEAKWALTSKESQDLWQHHYGDEIQFYIRCYQWVKDLKKTKFMSFLDQESIDLMDKLINMSTSLKENTPCQV